MHFNNVTTPFESIPCALYLLRHMTQPQIMSKASKRTRKHPYCPNVANCEAPYECIEGYCRITCKTFDNCPNEWRCGEDGFCLDGIYLHRQRTSANEFVDKGRRVEAQSAKIRKLARNPLPTRPRGSVPSSDREAPVARVRQPKQPKTATSAPNSTGSYVFLLAVVVVIAVMVGSFFLVRRLRKRSMDAGEDYQDYQEEYEEDEEEEEEEKSCGGKELPTNQP